MFRQAISILGLVSALAVPALVSAQTPQIPEKDEIPLFLQQLEQVVRAGSPPKYFALLADSADRDGAAAFTDSELVGGATRVVLQERDREIGRAHV